MSNNLKTIPKEIYQKVLKLLSPDDLLEICTTDKYTSNICDNNFYREYIQRNYNSKIYGFDKWDNTIFNNKIFNSHSWKDILKIILQHKIIPISIEGNKFAYIALHPNDSFRSFRDKIFRLTFMSKNISEVLTYYKNPRLTLYGKSNYAIFSIQISINYDIVELGYEIYSGSNIVNLCQSGTYYIPQPVVFNIDDIIGEINLPPYCTHPKTNYIIDNLFDVILELKIEEIVIF